MRQNVPVRTILAEWARLGGATVINGDRVAGVACSRSTSKARPEREALDIILRGVSGYMLAAREPGGAGASMFDRIMILPTSAAPRNPPASLLRRSSRMRRTGSCGRFNHVLRLTIRSRTTRALPR